MPVIFLSMLSGGRPSQRFSFVTWILFLAVILLAFSLRFVNLDYGLPLRLHSDEDFLGYRAMSMLNTGDLNPRWFAYPTLQIYLQTANLALYYLKLNSRMEHPPEPPFNPLRFYARGRALTALMGIATIAVLFFMCKSLFGLHQACWATVFLSFSFLHLRCSRYMTIDVPTGFWTLVALWGALLIARNKRFYPFALASIAAGFATATKYTGVVVLVPLFIAAALRMDRRNDKGWAFLWIPLFFLPAFWIGVPYSVWDFGRFVRDVAYEVNHYSFGIDSVLGLQNAESGWLHLADYLIRYDLGVLVGLLFLFGFLRGLIPVNANRFLLAIYALAYFLVLSRQAYHPVRNLIPILPVLCILAADLFVYIFDWSLLRWPRIGQSRRIAALAAGVILLSVPMMHDYRHVLQAGKTSAYQAFHARINAWLAGCAFGEKPTLGSVAVTRILADGIPARSATVYDLRKRGLVGLKDVDYLILEERHRPIIESNSEQNAIFSRLMERAKPVFQVTGASETIWRPPPVFVPCGAYMGPTITLYEIPK